MGPGPPCDRVHVHTTRALVHACPVLCACRRIRCWDAAGCVTACKASKAVLWSSAKKGAHSPVTGPATAVQVMAPHLQAT